MQLFDDNHVGGATRDSGFDHRLLELVQRYLVIHAQLLKDLQKVLILHSPFPTELHCNMVLV